MAALACGIEQFVQLGGATRLEKFGPPQWLAEIERSQPRPASAQWLVQQCFAIEAQDVEDHTGHRNFAAEEQIGLAAAEAFLEFKKRQGTPFRPAENFSVENRAAPELCSRSGDFGEGFGDALEVAGENFGPHAVGVDLRTDAVEFRFDPKVAAAEARGDRLRIGLGNRQHAFQWLENTKSPLGEASAGSQHRHTGKVAFEHIRLANFVGLGAECRSEAFLEQPFLEPNPQVAGEDFNEILRGGGGDRSKHSSEELGFSERTPCGAELTQKCFHLGQRWVSGAASARHDLRSREARVVQSARNRAVFGLGDS